MEYEKEQNCYNDVVSSILGFVTADALGVPAEFKKREMLKILPITDMIGYGSHNQPEGTWSDDSSMTIATMDSINECGKIDYEDIMKKFYEWEHNSKYTATGKLFDIGISTSNAIRKYSRQYPPTMCGGTEIYENGNGSLMRILPIVLYSKSAMLSFEEEVELINNASSLTHGHEISKLGCKIYSDYVKQLLEGKDKKEALENLSYIDYSKYYSKDSISKYKRILDGTLANLSKENIKSSGYVVDTLEASIWCTINSSSYKEATLTAVNLGDDTDTVGAITGSMVGLIYRFENIPANWIEKLKNKEYIFEICQKFANTLEKVQEKSKSL